MTNHWKIIESHVFLQKIMFFLENEATGLASHTEVRIGDAPKHPFPIETHRNIKSSDFGGRRQRRQRVNMMGSCLSDALWTKPSTRPGTPVPVTSCFFLNQRGPGMHQSWY